jgi:multidrug efflux pump subunit AcrB
VASILGLFVATVVFLAPRLGTEFFPNSDESQFSVTYKAPIGTRVEKTEQVARRMEEGVRQALGGDATSVKGAEVSPFTTFISDTGIPGGRAGIFSPNNGPYQGVLQVNLVKPSLRKLTDLEAGEKVRKAVQDAVPGTQVFLFTGGIVKRILNFGSSAPIDIEILGYDLEQGGAFAKKVADKLRASPNVTDVQISREENYPELDVVVDREKAGVLGLTEQQVAQAVLTSLQGNSQFAPVPFTDPQTGNEYQINVRLDDPFRTHVDDLAQVTLRTPGQKMVSLDTVARIRRSSGPVTINRKYLQRIVDVTANIAPGKDLGSASADAKSALDAVPLPEGFTAQLGGQTAAQQQAFGGMIFAALLALALVYMVLASQFQSLIDPLVIMFSVPMGVSGVILALLITGTTLSVNSFMGVIMMVGIVVSNGVLLVDFANVLRTRGLSLLEATIEAGRTRLRPILMTTLATVVGLIPMAAGLGEGSETNLPLARAVIGGLTVSTFFTLFLVPALYTLLDRFSRRTAPGDDTDAPAAGSPEPVHA